MRCPREDTATTRAPTDWSGEAMQRRIRRRYAADGAGPQRRVAQPDVELARVQQPAAVPAPPPPTQASEPSIAQRQLW